jgi:hypothetical protein
MVMLILSSIVFSYLIFTRYFPILGLHYMDKKVIELSTCNIVDLRDYNDAYNIPFQGAITIPLAYLKRNHNELPNSDLIVVASNHLEKNIGIRILRKKGFKVVGYTLTDLKLEVIKEKQSKKDIVKREVT